MRLIDTTTEDGIAGHISSGDIVIVRGFMSAQDCESAMAEAIDHGPRMAGEATYERGVSFLSTYDGGSPIGYYRFYSGPDPELPTLHMAYHRMRAISDAVRTTMGGGGEPGMDYHLEIFRYAKGTFFQRHTHDAEPQKVGLICLLSRHYPGQGGTVFYAGEDSLGTAETMRQGDLVLFPWGMEHEVTLVNGDDRWVALLPYY